MIARDYITEWRDVAPWAEDAQVEQDLVITRALIDIFSQPTLTKALAFRGGTALYKLYLKPAARYSEDIDLVQVEPGPIGETLEQVRKQLDPWLGKPKWQLKQGRVNLVYRFSSADEPPLALRLKIEINSREHFTEVGLIEVPLKIENRWFSGSATITTYSLDELLGTKMRALYQRKKGRDLFDLWHALTTADVQPERVVNCFLRYMKEGNHNVTQRQFTKNLELKRNDPRFLDDVARLLRNDVDWDTDIAAEVVLEQLIDRIPDAL